MPELARALGRARELQRRPATAGTRRTRRARRCSSAKPRDRGAMPDRDKPRATPASPRPRRSVAMEVLLQRLEQRVPAQRSPPSAWNARNARARARVRARGGARGNARRAARAPAQLDRRDARRSRRARRARAALRAAAGTRAERTRARAASHSREIGDRLDVDVEHVQESRDDGLYGLACAGLCGNSACSGLTPTTPAPRAPHCSTTVRRSVKSPMPQLRSERSA